MAETKKPAGRKPRRPGSMRSVLIAAVLLLVISGAVLSMYAAVIQILKAEQNVSNSMDRLFASIRGAEDASDGLTGIFDTEYLQRLEMLEHIRENEGVEPEETLSLADRYLSDGLLFLLDRRTGTVLDSRGELPPAEAVSALCAHLQTEVYDRSYYEYNGDRYYCMRVNDSLTVVQRILRNDYLRFMDNIFTPEEVIAMNLEEGHNIAVGVRSGTVEITAHVDEYGMPAQDLIEEIRELPSFISSETEEPFILAEVRGIRAIMLKRHVDRLGMDLYYGTSIEAAATAVANTVAPVWTGILLAVVLYVAYSYFLRDDYVNNRKETRMTKQLLHYKNSAFLALSVLACGSLAYYACTASGLSNFIRTYPEALKNAEMAYYDAVQCEKDVETDIDDSSIRDAQMVSAYLSDHPEQRTQDELNRISRIFRLEYAMLFDRTGTETVSDSVYVGYQISTDPSAQSYVFNPLKNGFPAVIRKTEVNELTGFRDRITAVTTKDLTGHVDGFLQMACRPDDLDFALSVTALSNTFDNSVLSNTFENFAVEAKEDGVIQYFPDHSLEGKPARENGFTDLSLRSGFTGYLEAGGGKYYAASKQVDDVFLYTALSIQDIFLGRTTYVVLSAVLVLLSILILTWRLERMAIPHRAEEEITRAEKIPQRRSDGTIKVETGQEEQNNVFLRKQTRRLLPPEWTGMSAEEKLSFVVGRVVLVLAVLFLLVVEFRDRLFGENNLISYALSMSWDRGFNIFAASASVIYGVMICVGAYFLRSVLGLIGRLLGARAETVCRLLSSCVKYIAAIAFAYVVFGFFGMDVRSLAASVGFLALIVGFGAKSLITDIIAGLFIIFEEEFQVGDIVEIGGYRGMVKEIGLRTTKVMSWDKNVKIINNHNISSVTNLTMRNSFATVNFRVPLTEDIDSFETVFRQEISQLPKKYPQIIGEPFFSGVSSFSGGGMDCWVSVEVEELDRGEMEKALAREVQEILSRNNIELK